MKFEQSFRRRIRGCELVMTKIGHRQQAAKGVFAAKPSTRVESRQSFSWGFWNLEPEITKQYPENLRIYPNCLVGFGNTECFFDTFDAFNGSSNGSSRLGSSFLVVLGGYRLHFNSMESRLQVDRVRVSRLACSLCGLCDRFLEPMCFRISVALLAAMKYTVWLSVSVCRFRFLWDLIASLSVRFTSCLMLHFSFKLDVALLFQAYMSLLGPTHGSAPSRCRIHHCADIAVPAQSNYCGWIQLVS